MAKNFTVMADLGFQYTAVPVTKANSVYIPAGSFITLSSQLAVLATAGSTLIAFTEAGADTTDTTVMVIPNTDVQYKGVGSGNYSTTYKGTAYDIAVAGNVQTVNYAGTTNAVLKVSPADETNRGIVTTATPVVVQIPTAKHIFG